MGISRVDMISKVYPNFVPTCDSFFDKLDFHHQQNVSSEAAAASVSIVFDVVRAALTDHGISLRERTNDEVLSLFRERNWDTNRRLNRPEFHQYCANLIFMAGFATASCSVQDYGLSAVGGIVGFVMLKQVLQAVPVVRLLVVPTILGLLPGAFVGPVLGVFGMYQLKRVFRR